MPVADSTATVDARLASVRAALDRCGTALYEFETDPACVLLPTAPLTGRTAIAWTETAERLALAWELFSVARDALQLAVAARGTRQWLSNVERAEVASRLTEPVVVIGADVLARIPAATDGLALASPSRLDDLIGVVAALTERVRGVATEVDAVWDRVLPALKQLDRELTELEERVAAEHLRAPNDLAAGRALIVELRQQAAGDALAVDAAALAAIESSVERARAAITTPTVARAELATQLAAATASLAQLADLVDTARREEADAAAKIADADAGPDLDAIAAELARLDVELADIKGLADDEWDLATRRLARLDQQADLLGRRARDAEAAAGSALRARDELRGRLDAFRAKAFATGRAEDPDLDELHAKALNELHVAPCDLGEARRLVEAYQHQVNNPIASEGWA